MKKLALALDVEDFNEAVQILKQIEGEELIIKIGYRLFIKEGRKITDLVKKIGFELFLDLKLHDIPNTVYNGVKSALDLGADYLTLHSLGGKEMLESAVKAKENTNLKLLAVSILTSHTEDYPLFLGSKYTLKELALKLAKMSVEVGIDGIVSSPFEVKDFKNHIKKQFLSITPGIRLPENQKDDQKRVATPEFAIKQGANILVVGRPILQAKDKKQKIKQILSAINNA